MRGYFSFSFLLLLQVFSLTGLQAQSLRGFYTGQLKLAANGAKLSAQLELMEDSGRYSAVLRSRVVEGIELSGCDNWFEGKMEDGRLHMENKASLRETNVPPGSCQQFKYARLAVKQENGTISITGNLNDFGGDYYGKLILTRIDTVLSFSVAEEAVEAKRKMGEIFIASGRSDKEIIERMLSVRSTTMSDSVSFVPLNASLKVEAPDADIYHKLTVVIDGTPVLIATSPRQQGAVLRLKEMVPGNMEVVFLCYHLMVDVWYNLKITLNWEGGEKQWTLPVSTLGNQGILLKILETPK